MGLFIFGTPCFGFNDLRWLGVLNLYIAPPQPVLTAKAIDKKQSIFKGYVDKAAL